MPKCLVWKRPQNQFLLKGFDLVQITSTSNNRGYELCWDTRFQRAFTVCICIFKVITLAGSNQRNYFENATTCSTCTLKTRVATLLKQVMKKKFNLVNDFFSVRGTPSGYVSLQVGANTCFYVSTTKIYPFYPNIR